MQHERNGVRLHVDDHGAGRPLVLVHGVWMSARYFARQLPLTKDGLRLVIPDLRGHGRSEDPGRGHTVSGYADDVNHLLERLDLRDVVLVGWSMGAMVLGALICLREGGLRFLGRSVVACGTARKPLAALGLSAYGRPCGCV